MAAAALALAFTTTAFAQREPVLKQIDLPHSYYFREMYLPQLTSGPSSVAFSPDGASLVYSMAGSLWRQEIGSDRAVELTHGPGYDYQPDWSPDGKSIVFARHRNNAIELWQLDLSSGTPRQLTTTEAVNVEPRYSPDGKRLAYVSTAGSGHFNLFVAPIDGDKLGAARTVVAPRESKIARYYYSKHDHTINPSWTPDGRRLVFVSNREIAYGTGDLCSAAVDSTDVECFLHEETSWRGRPEVAPDGRRVLYSSYQGRQWHQLWLTTLAGDAQLPLTFGDFDVTGARWSPDGRRIAYISNEDGDLKLQVREVVGGTATPVWAGNRQYQRPMGQIRVVLRNSAGRVYGRVSVLGADGRYYADAARWVHADDGFDPKRQQSELRYFHCYAEACTVTVPVGDVQVTAWLGQEHVPVQQHFTVRADATTEAALRLEELKLPEWAPPSVTADLHVHMNYGGHYRSTPTSLGWQARAEDLDVAHNLIVNKEQRIPDIDTFKREPETSEAAVFSGQEYHTSFWGHLGLLHPASFLTPDFSAYQHSALSSPYPHNGVIADMAHERRALVGYVHPFDWVPVPEREPGLTNALPADVARSRVDYIEVVGFSDHKSTAEVWYKLLNLGFRVPAGAGTDAMANYASLRGPVGMNRVYLNTGGSVQRMVLINALREGRTFASNGPQLALEVDGKVPGDTLTLPAGGQTVRYRAALRSPVAIDHFELVQNGRVVARHKLAKARTHADVSGQLKLRESGWIVLRAWNEGADPLILDLYPYGTTSPVYVSVGGAATNSPADAKYFVHWLDRVIAAAEGRTDYNDDRERQATLDYLHAAQAVYVQKAQQ